MVVTPTSKSMSSSTMASTSVSLKGALLGLLVCFKAVALQALRFAKKLMHLQKQQTMWPYSWLPLGRETFSCRCWVKNSGLRSKKLEQQLQHLGILLSHGLPVSKTSFSCALLSRLLFGFKRFNLPDGGFHGQSLLNQYRAFRV